MADTAHNLSNARKTYLGVTKEGIKILRPKGRVDNITLAQARKAVAAVRQAQADAVKSKD
ncbi:hypothetical protein [Asticcacaulis sp. AND118]|uniref:hypothetical protein n=1 Tax=Asticcacaulis sp. AND118 TaxID=2840468 RepID=UPI001CFFCDB5|nr:hypothetical protein [Asticcacaulis sp. AND118]UDF02915.1 hypothetical protein LH365_10795 [Asticcacaulis sp. AND118]